MCVFGYWKYLNSGFDPASHKNCRILQSEVEIAAMQSAISYSYVVENEDLAAFYKPNESGFACKI
jgi:hypothetical protein